MVTFYGGFARSSMRAYADCRSAVSGRECSRMNLSRRSQASALAGMSPLILSRSSSSIIYDTAESGCARPRWNGRREEPRESGCDARLISFPDRERGKVREDAHKKALIFAAQERPMVADLQSACSDLWGLQIGRHNLHCFFAGNSRMIRT